MLVFFMTFINIYYKFIQNVKVCLKHLKFLKMELNEKKSKKKEI